MQQCEEHPYMCEKIEIIANRQEGISKKVDEIHSALLGSLEETGWITRIRDVEKQIGGFNRIAIYIISAAGGGLIIWVGSLILKIIKL